MKKVCIFALSALLIFAFTIPTSAASAMLQKTGTSFNNSFSYTVNLTEPGSSFVVGKMKYGFEIRSVLYDRDYSICICEHDYDHYSVLVEGIGSGTSKMYSSDHLYTHGNASLYKRHYGPTVSYGATIEVS